MTAYQAELPSAGYGEITTEIAPAGAFYYAEDYHQQYLLKNPFGYRCHSKTGVPVPRGLTVADLYVELGCRRRRAGPYRPSSGPWRSSGATEGSLGALPNLPCTPSVGTLVRMSDQRRPLPSRRRRRQDRWCAGLVRPPPPPPPPPAERPTSLPAPRPPGEEVAGPA